jgi:hypothetical protein
MFPKKHELHLVGSLPVMEVRPRANWPKILVTVNPETGEVFTRRRGIKEAYIDVLWYRLELEQAKLLAAKAQVASDLDEKIQR